MNGHTYKGREHWIRLWQFYQPNVRSGYWTPFDLGGVVSNDLAVVWCERHTRSEWIGRDPPPQARRYGVSFISRSTMVFRADLSRARLSGANLISASLESACLAKADMEFALMANTVLRGACLREADMSGAQLDGAVLTGADLCKANLRGAGFRHARLTLLTSVMRGLVVRSWSGRRCGTPICEARICARQSSTAQICLMRILEGWTA